jgi:hypothetical protein
MQALQAMQTASTNKVMPALEAKSADNHVALPAALSFPENVYREGALTTPLPNNWSASCLAGLSATGRSGAQASAMWSSKSATACKRAGSASTMPSAFG